MNRPLSKLNGELTILSSFSRSVLTVLILLISSRQRCFLRSARQLSSIKHRFTQVRGNGFSEKPVPVVILNGETTDYKKWIPTTQMFLENGYHGLILDLPYSDSKISDKVENRVDKEVNALEALLKKELLSVPPIVIAESVPTFLMQKFLESYAVTSLFLIDPFPPDPVKFRTFYEQRLSENNDKIPPTIHHLYREIITDESQRVNLEANSLPLFAILLGNNSEKDEISRQFISFHGIDEELILRLPKTNSVEELLDSSSYSENNCDLHKLHDFLLFWSDATL